MKTRIITGLCYGLVVLFCITISSFSFPFPAILLFIAMAVVGAWEMENLMREKLSKFQRSMYYLSVLSFVPAVLVIHFVYKGVIKQAYVDSFCYDMIMNKAGLSSYETLLRSSAICSKPIFSAMTYSIILFALASILSFMQRAIKGGPEKAKNSLKFVASAFYIFFPFLCASVMISFSVKGIVWLLLAVVTPWISDTAAYFTGTSFGKKKIFDKLSPNKTLVGFMGAELATAILYFIFAAICVLPNQRLGFFASLGMLLIYVIVGLIAALISQAGDLLASVIKRNAGVKDFGKIFPGHGGMMDRIDSMLFSIPFVFFLFLLNANII